MNCSTRSGCGGILLAVFAACACTHACAGGTRETADAPGLALTLSDSLSLSLFLPPVPGGVRPMALAQLAPQPATPPAASVSAPAAAAAGGAQAVQEALLAVTVNSEAVSDAALVLLRGGDVLVAGEDLQHWRLRRPAQPAMVREGMTYYALSGIAGLAQHIDEAAQRLVIEAQADAFEMAQYGARPAARLLPSHSGSGGFVNYDFFLSQGGGDSSRAALFEGGYFNRYGVGTSTFVAEDIGGSEGAFTRLETTWTHDNPDALTSWRLGDSINRTGMWGRAVRFGGIQYGTNFATQPAFVTTPLQSATGQALVPSTVDVYINHALVSQREVAPGPFDITDLPAINGRGDVQVVVRDVLGREQVISQPFYASPILLRKGLNDFSYEVGFVRDNFGLASADYGSPVAVLTQRHGFSDYLTAEVHAEAQGGHAATGIGGNLLLSSLGVFSGALAASAGNRGGALALFGFERQADPWSFNVASQWATPDFAQVGLADERPPARQTAASASYSAGRLGALGIAYVSQDNRGRGDVRVYSANYSLSLGRLGFIGFNVVRAVSATTDTAFSLTLTVPLGTRRSVSVSQQTNRGDSGRSGELSVATQQSLPAGSGYGYHALWRDSRYAEAGLALQNDVGTYEVDVASFNGATTTRLDARGGAAILGGGVFAARSIDDSFGVVQVPGYAGVRVMVDNQVVARTDAAGNALVPRLRAYDRNPVSIVQDDLPMDARIDTLNLEVAPYYRSGVLLAFPIARSHGALLRIVLDDGQPLPAGALVKHDGSAEAFPVAYNGEAYVTDLMENNRMHAEWHGQTCDFDVRFLPGNDPLPSLGTFACKGVRP